MRFILECNPEHEAAPPLLDWFKGLGLADPWLEVRPWNAEDTLRRLRGAGWPLTISLKAHPRTRRRHYNYKESPVPDAAEAVRRHAAAAGGVDKVVWQALLEDDSSGVSISQEILSARVRSRREYLARLEQYLAEARAQWEAHPGVVAWGLAGFSASAHAYARAGAQLVMVERANDDCDDLQTGMAFARGAARQHGVDWGADLSLWWGPIHGCIEKLPARFHAQTLLASWASGAGAWRLEGGDLWVDGTGRPTRVARELAPVIRAIDAMGRVDPGRGAAIILPRDNALINPSSYDPSPVSGTYARLEPDLAQWGMAAFFRAAFPGCAQERDPFPFGAYQTDDPPASPFALSCVTPQFSPSPSDVRDAKPPVPFGRFHGRDDARAHFESGSVDPAPFRPLGATRWTAPFDVLTDEVLDRPDAADFLAAYPVVLALGDCDLAPEGRQAALRGAAERGSRLFACAGTATPASEALFGVRFRGDLGMTQAWSSVAGGQRCDEPLRFAIAEAADGETRLRAATASGAPLVVEKLHGRGSATLCLAPWGLADGAALCGAAMEQLERLLRPLDRLAVDGSPLLAACGELEQGRSRVAVAANVESGPWTGALGHGGDPAPAAIAAHGALVLRDGREVLRVH